MPEDQTDNRMRDRQARGADKFASEVADARLLLDFMVAERTLSEGEGTAAVVVPEEIILTIKQAREAVVLQQPDNSELKASFLMAYQRLVRLAKPVTADSLKATDKEFGRVWGLPFFRSKLSEAGIWSRKLWTATIILILLAITGEMLPDHFTQFVATPDSDDSKDQWCYLMVDLLNRLTPFIFGALGACAYLLRSAQHYIRLRTFDRRCVPEYFNRMLLGAVSGGAIILFITQVQTEDGETVQLGASALGFLAGYNTEFLFNTIERIIAAILPKVDVTTVKKAPPPPPPNIEIMTGDLLRALEKTEDEATKTTIRDILKKLQERL